MVRPVGTVRVVLGFDHLEVVERRHCARQERLSEATCFRDADAVGHVLVLGARLSDPALALFHPRPNDVLKGLEERQRIRCLHQVRPAEARRTRAG